MSKKLWNVKNETVLKNILLALCITLCTVYYNLQCMNFLILLELCIQTAVHCAHTAKQHLLHFVTPPFLCVVAALHFQRLWYHELTSTNTHTHRARGNMYRLGGGRWGGGYWSQRRAGGGRLVTEGGGTVWRKVATRGIRGTGWRAHGASWKGRQHTGGSHNPSRARVFDGASNRQRNE